MNGDHVDNHYDPDDNGDDNGDGDHDHDHDGGHGHHNVADKNLLDCHQRLPDVFGPPMEGNLVQSFLYQADKYKIFTGQISSGPCLFDHEAPFPPPKGH